MMFEPRRLHPVTVVIEAMMTARQFIIPVGIWAVFQLRNMGINALLWLLFGGVAFLVLAFIWGYISWRWYTYRLENGELRIEYGVLFKKRRFIPLERIQSVDYVEGIFHRLFGVVKVRVETAANSGQNAELQAVSRQEAEQLREMLTLTQTAESDHAGNDRDPGESEGEALQGKRRQITPREVVILGLTSSSIGVIFSVIGAVFSFFAQFFPVESMFEFIGRFINIEATFQFISFALIVTLTVALVTSIASNALKFGNFRLTRLGDRLLLERGLIERRRSTIPVKRIQAVRFEEGFLRQPFGFTTVRVVSAGYSGEAEDDSDTSSIIFPLLAKRQVETFLREFLPEFAVEDVTLNRVPRRSWRRFVFVNGLLSALVAGVLAYFFYPWGLISLALIAIAVLYGHWCYRDEAWHLTGDYLMLRSRIFARSTVIVTRRRIQSSSIKQTLFQRRANLATFEVDVAGWLGKGFNVRHIDQEDADRLLEWTSHHASRQFEK